MTYSTKLLDQVIGQNPDNHKGNPRRMGVEIEFAGVVPEQIVEAIHASFGGQVNWISPFEINIDETELGQFKVELDSKGIKQLGEDSTIAGNPAEAKDGIERTYIETISSLAAKVVPWEVVSPPIEFSKLNKLFPLIDKYRALGAKGTKHQLQYAFGVHLNPELPDLTAKTIVNYLKSFFCLFEWIKVTDKTDMARRITPFINHFSADYIKKVLRHDYAPSLDQLMRDYLEDSPTRNRSVDLLPLFAFINEDLLREYVDDDRVNARPTFHYRLPNCDIDNPDWNLDTTIEMWMAVELLAFDEGLQAVCNEYLSESEKTLSSLSSNWSDRVQQLLNVTEPVVAPSR